MEVYSFYKKHDDGKFHYYKWVVMKSEENAIKALRQSARKKLKRCKKADATWAIRNTYRKKYFG